MALHKLQKQLKQSAIDMTTDFINSDCLAEELPEMLSQIGDAIVHLQKVTSIHDLFQELERDEFSILGYCSGAIDDLFEDAF